MYLMLVVNGTCAKVYARASKHDSLFGGYRSVLIWHQRRQNSLSASLLPEIQHDDLFVTFKSPKPFKAFCEQFTVSEYNNPKRFHIVTHNCADASRFALQLADLDIELPRALFRKALAYSSLIYTPGMMSTPIALYEAAKSLKIKQLDDTSFKEWSNSYKKLATVCEAHPGIYGEIILNEFEQQAQQNPHQIEYAKKAIDSTLSILSGTARDNELVAHARNTFFYKTNTGNQMCRWFGRFLDSYLAMLLIEQLLIAMQLEDKWFYALDWSKFALIVLSICLIVREFNKSDDGHTVLSSAMEELTTDIEIVIEDGFASQQPAFSL